MIYSPGDINGDVRLSTEVVVIGSGAGGATIAKELSSEGRKVIVLEAGGHFTRDDFNLRVDDSYFRMYWYGGLFATLGAPVVVLPFGKTVGGTTTVNSGTCFRIPHHVLKRWHLEFGLWDITEDELDLLYSAVEEYLFVQKADPDVTGRNPLLFLEGARKLGFSGGLLRRNAKDCEGYGVCAFGCPSDAKQSANISYIPDAVKSGCDIYTRCTCEEVLIRSGKAVGVKGRFSDANGAPGPAIEVEAEVVVLSAGTLHTPRFLQVQGICNSSGQVGRNLTVHPCSGALALTDEKLDCPKGIPQATYVDEFADEGIMLEGGSPPPVGTALAIAYKGKRNAELMRQHPYLGLFAAMLSEHSSSGRVRPHRLNPGQPFVTYNIRGDDRTKFKFMTEMLAEIWFSVGAKSVYTNLAGFPELRSAADLKRLRNTRVRIDDFIGVTGFHPLGTCRMGSDPDNSVVKHTGETWEVDNLFIVDGSIVPTSLGVNPQMTIFALATRCAGFIDDKLTPAAG